MCPMDPGFPGREAGGEQLNAPTRGTDNTAAGISLAQARHVARPTARRRGSPPFVGVFSELTFFFLKESNLIMSGGQLAPEIHVTRHSDKQITKQGTRFFTTCSLPPNLSWHLNCTKINS